MDPLANQFRGGVDQADHTKAVRVEPGVVGQSRAEVAEANDDHWPIVSRADNSADLELQVLHAVADPASAVRTQKQQILAKLGGVHTRGTWICLESGGRSPMLTRRRARRRVSREGLRHTTPESALGSGPNSATLRRL